jgi:hypothetical protein
LQKSYKTIKSYKITQTLLLIQMAFRNLTFTAESCFVLVEPFESDFLPDELEELVEGRTALLVVVHVLLSLLTLPAIHQPDLKIETEKSLLVKCFRDLDNH